MHLNQLPKSESENQDQSQSQQPITQSQSQPSNPVDGSEILSTDQFDNEFFQPKKMSVDSTVVENTIVATPQAPTPSQPIGLTPDQAARNTEILMDARDTIQSFGISYFSDGDLKHSNLYAYQDWQKQRLIKAWTPIVQKLNINVTPWLDVIIAESICTAPLVGLAAQNRKLRLENEKQAKRIAELQAKETEHLGSRNRDVRTDNKNAWSIDENGFFKYNAKGNQYLKKDDRHEKVQLTDANYTMLVKHNGEELVNKVFKIS